MPVQLSCPCGKLLRVRDELVGKRVKCPACGESLLVKQTALKRKEEVIEAEDEEPRPRKKKSVDEDTPRPRKRAVEDDERDEDDERPARKTKKRKEAKGTSPYLWLAIGGGGALVAGAVVLILVLTRGGDGTGQPNPDKKAGGDQPLTEAEKRIERALGSFYTAYAVHMGTGRPPANMNDLEGWGLKQVAGDQQTITEIKQVVGTFEVLWNVDVGKLPPGNFVLAWHKDVPSKGGFVLLTDRNGTSCKVEKMTPERFRSAPKADQPKDSGKDTRKPFLDEKKSIPSRLEWNRQIMSRKGGAISFRVVSQGPFAVTLVTDRAYQALKAGGKVMKQDILLTADSPGPELERSISVPAGSCWFIIENQSPNAAEIRLQCFEGAP